MATAFVLGNGRSRSVIDLARLHQHGVIYGCNALYRDFEPDVLIAADRAISEQIQHSGYSQKHKFYTRKPIEGLGARRVPQEYWGFSSGQIAVAVACMDRHCPVFMLGFDLGSTDTKFNNVYADTEFYKRSSDRPTYSGNWIKQIIRVAKDYQDCVLVRVMGAESAAVPEFSAVNNIQHMPMTEFVARFQQ